MVRRILAGLLSVVLFTSSALAATYYVDCNSGNNSNPGTYAQPWLTLRFAGESISSGDDVIVKSGSECTVTKANNDHKWGPNGTSGNYTSWTCETRGACNIYGCVHSSGSQIMSYIRFEGFNFPGTNGPGGAVNYKGGFRIAGIDTGNRSHHMEFVGNTIRGGCVDGDTWNDNSNFGGIYLNDARDSTISDNEFTAISVPGSTCTGFDQTKCDTNAGDKVCCGCGGPGGDCGAAIRFFNTNDILYEHNRCHDVANECIADKQGGYDNVYRRSLFNGYFKYAFNLNNQNTSYRPQIYENIVDCRDNSTAQAVFAHRIVKDGDVYSNTFYLCAETFLSSLDIPPTTDPADLAAETTSGWEHWNNIYHRTSYSAQPNFAWYYNPDAKPAKMDYNSYGFQHFIAERGCSGANSPARSGCTRAFFQVSNVTSTSLTNTWRGVSGFPAFDAHSIVAVGSFVDDANGNFHLAPGAPQIGAGEGGVDMGAYPRGNDGTIIGVRSSGGGAVTPAGGRGIRSVRRGRR